MIKRPKQPPLEQIVQESIPPADSVIVPTSFESLQTQADAPASPATPTAPATPTDRKPSELQLAVFALGRLNGRERTVELLRLKTQYGGLKVEETIVDMIRLGFMDEGQVLTAKGTLILLKYGGA